MIYYMNHTLPINEHFWRPVPESFQTDDAKSNKMWFKIGDTIYPVWSEAFEQAVTWDRLSNA